MCLQQVRIETNILCQILSPHTFIWSSEHTMSTDSQISNSIAWGREALGKTYKANCIAFAKKKSTNTALQNQKRKNKILLLLAHETRFDSRSETTQVVPLVLSLKTPVTHLKIRGNMLMMF